MKGPSLPESCGVDGLNDISGIGVEVLVEAELVLDTGRDRSDEASAAVLVLAPIVMREEVVDGKADAEVQDLVRSAVGRADVTRELRGVEVEALALSSRAAASASPLDDDFD